jgi:hypothetical protein
VKLNKRIRMCYDKGNYEEFNKAISETEWENLLIPMDHINTYWTKFHDKIRELEKRFVPSRQVKQTTKRKRGNYPMDKKTLEKIKEKHALCRKSINSKDPKVRKEYNKVRNQVKNLTNKLKRKNEQSLSSNAKKNPKAIWKYIKSKSKSRTGIDELLTDQSNPNSAKTDEDKEKAEILANFFNSVFTKGPETPNLNVKDTCSKMPPMNIKEEDISKILRGLKEDKSPGPDRIHPRVLKELALTISKPLCIILNQSLEAKQYLATGKKHK